MNKIVCTILCLFYFTSAGWARADVLKFDNVEQEQRYHALIKELRCLVCQNQNLADSNADLAKDLRDKTYEMIVAGSSDREIIDYMVNRYGDFVLYRPPVKMSTVLLWVGPFIILLIGLFVITRVIRNRQTQAAATLSERQHERAQRLLHENSPE